MERGMIVPRADGASRLFGYRGTMSMLIIGLGLALAGCAYGTVPDITPKYVADSIAATARLEKEREERKARMEKERRKKLERELEVDIAKIVGAPTCYSGDVRDLDDLARQIHRYEAGAPEVQSLTATTETWRREYGTGGGGGGC